MSYERAALDNQALGYWRGASFEYPGSGSGMGKSAAGTAGFTQGQGFSAITSGYHPTVLYLLGLLVAEMIVFGVIGRMLK